MEKPTFISLVERLLKKIVWIDLCSLILVALVNWIAGWHTVAQFSTSLFWSGAILIVIGIISVVGTITNIRSFGYEYPSTAGLDDTRSRTIKSLQDIHESYGFLILMVLAGGILIGVSTLILLVIQ